MEKGIKGKSKHKINLDCIKYDKGEVAMRKQEGVRVNRMIIALLVLTIFMNGTGLANAQYQDVPTAGIAVNGKTVDGINPIKINGTYHLPFVKLAKVLGYNHIQFEQETLTYEVTDGSTSVRATMGGTLARRGDEYIHVEPPRWMNETAYVSLNAGSALFNANISFNSENGSIQVQKPAQFYVVQKDESLWEIAEAHHTTVQQLKAVNHLKTNMIVVGQRLTIPPRDKAKEMEPIEEEKPIDTGKNAGTVNGEREKVLNQASEYIGAEYKFGATLDEAPQLFDCSSFTKFAFLQNGVHIPRVSRDQASIGRYVKELQAGDLMFFTDNELYSDGRVGHVGIYMGDGSMIHASSSLGVSITDNVLANPYWGANYLFSKRVIE